MYLNVTDFKRGGVSYEVKYGNLMFDQKLLIFLNENV